MSLSLHIVRQNKLPNELRSVLFVNIRIKRPLGKILLDDEADDLHPLGEELPTDQLHRENILGQSEVDLEDGLAHLGQLEAAVAQTSGRKKLDLLRRSVAVF